MQLRVQSWASVQDETGSGSPAYHIKPITSA